MIAGKIIPAIATSTALIVGMCGMELIKSLTQPEKVEISRNAYVNLATPLWLFSEPMPPLYQEDKEYDPIMMGPVKAIPSKFSCWDKTIIEGPKTLGEICDFYKEKFKVEITMIAAGKIMLLNSYAGNNEAKKAKDPITVREEILEEKYPPWKSTYEMVVSGEYTEKEGDDPIDCIMPNLIYQFTSTNDKQKKMEIE